MQHADRLTFAYEAVTGASLPSSTPATNALLATQQATSVFAFKRENLTLFLQEFFNDLVLPQLFKDLTPEHILRFTGNAMELYKIDEASAEIVANDFIKDKVIKGEVPELEELEALKQLAIERYRKTGESRFLKIKEKFYDDIEFEFDFIIGNEQVDPNVIAQNTQAVLMAVAQNPMILQDPRIKMLFFKYAETLGVSPAEMELADEQSQQMAPQGQPQLPSGPLPPTQAEGQLPNMQPQL
jgi:hypothetical protein